MFSHQRKIKIILPILLVSFLLFPTVVFADLPSLVGYWKFDETSAGTFQDSSTSDHDATGIGPLGGNNTPQPTTTVAPTEFSNPRAIDFDGTDDYVSLNNPFTGNDFTISMWVNPDALNTGSYQGFIGRAAIGESVGGGGWNYRAPGLWIGTDNGSLHYDSYNTAGTRYSDVINNFFTSINQWVHIAWVKDGTSYDIYKNGTLVVDGATAPENLYIAGTDYNIGRVDNYINGQIDDVRIYNTALSFDQITELANGENPTDPAAIPEFSNTLYILLLTVLMGYLA